MDKRKGFKAFKKGMICKGKQYAENTIFEEGDAVPRKKGMHYCIYPLDVFEHYPFFDNDGNFTEFAEVEALEEPVTDDNKKFCTTKLKIGSKISFKDYIKAAFKVTCEKIKEEAKADNNAGSNNSKLAGGNYSTLAGGDNSKLTSGENSLIISDNDSIAKGGIGSVITLVKREHGKIVSYKTEFVDGERIKADTFYELEGGKFKEVDYE